MPDPTIESILPALTARVRQVMKQQGVPGVALGIVRDQALAWSGGFGFADLAAALPLDEHTLFGVASITKTLTGLAIVQLRDEGKLGLNDPLVRHLPEAAALRNPYGRAEDVTLRGLLTHRSGLVGEPPTGHWSKLAFPSIGEILALLPRLEVVIEPASAFKYCNLAFALLGEVVARVSGRPFVDYARDEILIPLGMTSSGFEIEGGERARTATGYMSERYEDVPAIAPDPAMNGYAAAAGLRTSVADLARWAMLQFRTKAAQREGSQILAGRSIAEMHRVTYVEVDWKSGYAMPWVAARLGENAYLTHGGSVPGFLSLLAFHKPSRSAVLVLTNKQGHSACDTIALAALEMLTVSIANEAPSAAAAAVPAPAAYKRLLGRYASEATWGHVMHIEFRGGALLLVSPPDPYFTPTPPPSLLAATDDANVFVVKGGRPAGEPLSFEVDGERRVIGFVLGDNGHRYRKAD